MAQDQRFSAAPETLVNARLLSHTLVQWPSLAARANLPARADDSHSALHYSREHHALLCQPLGDDGQYQLGFDFTGCEMLWVIDGQADRTLAIRGLNDAQIGHWCEDHLANHGLKPAAAAEMPYELEPQDLTQLMSEDRASEVACLGAWFAWMHEGLEQLGARHGPSAVIPPSVRCWPHHFDIATLFTLDEGDTDSARSVGTGLSPGDDSYAQPYLYCTPWPAPAALTAAPGPWDWNTEEFTALVCPVSRVDATTDRQSLLEAAFSAAVGLLNGAPLSR